MKVIVAVIPGRVERREPGISRFRVWSFGPSRNDDVLKVSTAVRMRSDEILRRLLPRRPSLSGF
jgi:hypothetical protein